ncbi:abortive infection family protein, partial [Escherichia coli]|nr:abortive infection family protein [Escherichia coli]
HAASNILETMAKEITQNPNVANESLGGFFKQFEKMSKLPKNLIDVVKDIYDLRNKLPTAGHGSLNRPELTMVEAITIAAMTKAILEIEYRSKAI